jgi:hypothetical protein
MSAETYGPEAHDLEAASAWRSDRGVTVVDEMAAYHARPVGPMVAVALELVGSDAS